MKKTVSLVSQTFRVVTETIKKATFVAALFANLPGTPKRPQGRICRFQIFLSKIYHKPEQKWETFMSSMI